MNTETSKENTCKIESNISSNPPPKEDEHWNQLDWSSEIPHILSNAYKSKLSEIESNEEGEEIEIEGFDISEEIISGELGVSEIILEYLDQNGELEELLSYTRADYQNLCCELFDKSIFGWYVVYITDEYDSETGVCLSVVLRKSLDSTTNITPDLIESIVRLLKSDDYW